MSNANDDGFDDNSEDDEDVQWWIGLTIIIVFNRSQEYLDHEQIAF